MGAINFGVLNISHSSLGCMLIRRNKAWCDFFHVDNGIREDSYSRQHEEVQEKWGAGWTIFLLVRLLTSYGRSSLASLGVFG